MKFLESPENFQVVEDLVTMGTMPYMNAHRHYHNVNHINGMANWAGEHLPESKLEMDLMLAITWHDYIILNRPDMPGKEEEMSAIAFLSAGIASGVPREECMAIVGMIADTSRHFSSDTVMQAMSPQSKTLLSLDLLGLGADPDTFAKNTVNIYREYLPAICNADAGGGVLTYLHTRKKLFQTLLDRTNIYYDDDVRAELEMPARANLTQFVAGGFDKQIEEQIEELRYIRAL
jgi:predicted metal-dependent HD superfamily phosphohydrolase